MDMMDVHRPQQSPHTYHRHFDSYFYSLSEKTLASPENSSLAFSRCGGLATGWTGSSTFDWLTFTVLFSPCVELWGVFWSVLKPLWTNIQPWPLSALQRSSLTSLSRNVGLAASAKSQQWVEWWHYPLAFWHPFKKKIWDSNSFPCFFFHFISRQLQAEKYLTSLRVKR